MALALTSSAFTHNGAIPKQYTCQGADISVPLAWSGLPAATKSLVLIVDDPDAVTVDETEGRNRTRLEVKVGPGDLGRVIGRRGRTAQSIRTLVRAAAAKDGLEEGHVIETRAVGENSIELSITMPLHSISLLEITPAE